MIFFSRFVFLWNINVCITFFFPLCSIFKPISKLWHSHTKIFSADTSSSEVCSRTCIQKCENLKERKPCNRKGKYSQICKWRYENPVAEKEDIPKSTGEGIWVRYSCPPLAWIVRPGVHFVWSSPILSCWVAGT